MSEIPHLEERMRRIKAPISNGGFIRSWKTKEMKVYLKEFLNVVAKEYISEGGDYAKERAISLGRVLQIGWYRRQPNDKIFADIERLVRANDIILKSKQAQAKP
jgi:hypothetical protein